ncbi:MAG: DUF3568 family protein [Syntrophales bacterium]|jgi:hypothetical protein
MTKREIVVFLLLATSLLSGCGTCVLIPFIGSAEVIPVAGGSYQGYTVWKGRESSKYYTYDIKTICQAVKQSCEQLKLETVIRNPVSENGCSLETKGNYPMEINVSNVDKNLTKVVITVALFGDKQYAELLYRTIDDNIPKKMDNIPTTTDNIHNTTTSDR